jgi:hypothetical protein
MKKVRGTKKDSTFGIHSQSYEKAVVASGLNHYLGKGVQSHNGLGP